MFVSRRCVEVGAGAAVVALFEASGFVAALFDDAVAVGAAGFFVAVSECVVVGLVVGGPGGFEGSGEGGGEEVDVVSGGGVDVVVDVPPGHGRLHRAGMTARGSRPGQGI